MMRHQRDHARVRKVDVLDLLSHERVIYILEMHLLALIFYVVLYLPFALYDLTTMGKASHKGHKGRKGS